MLGQVIFQNLASVSVVLNGDNAIYPILRFQSDIVQAVDERPKSAQDGLWPVRNYDRQMDITIEGAILADDSADYTTKRQTLVNCIRYKPVGARLTRDGVLKVDFYDNPEFVVADVTLMSFSAPRSGASPNYSDYRLVFRSVLPWYIGEESGNPYYDE